MDEEDKQPADVSARLDEEQLIKPGTEIKPGQAQASAAVKPHNLEKDVIEFNQFAAAQEESQQEQNAKGSSGIFKIVWEILSTLLLAGLVVFVINTFIFQAYYVSGNSMNPGYHDGDYVLANKIPTTARNISGFFGKKPNLDVKRGDVLIFHPPYDESIFYIKRVIGLPGDRVVLKDGKFTIYNSQYPNGLQLKEPYIDPAYKTQFEVDEVVLDGNLFMVGDNRSPGGSYDSREWGQLNQDKILGSVFFRLLPINDLGIVPAVNYAPAQP